MALKAASPSLGEPSQGLDTRSTAGQETCIHSQTVLEVETCCRRNAGTNRGQDLVVLGGRGVALKMHRVAFTTGAELILG